MTGISPGFNRKPQCVPPTGTAPGTVHWLTAYGGSTRTKFLWTGNSWSTPGTGYSTDPIRMCVLGWQYDAAELPAPPLSPAPEKE